MWRIGLTGGIGSGKSTVAAFLSQRGATVLDADAMAKSCTEAGGSAIPAIAKAFGNEFIAGDGSMNRQKVRSLVFQQPGAKATLESIIHPLVHEAMEAAVAGSRAPAIVFDVPLLVESGLWPVRVDRVWVVDCTEETQFERVRERNGWDDKTISSVISSQAPRLKRLAAADAVIANDGYGLERLRSRVDQLAAHFGL
ncbi:dephospho-CoA kinase [Hydrogenophaga sp. 5NK40-0174]|uniref:dephospho-CoA kinase n=1 Tax=Hydrogenophaga sp. 5NK40-0174 TaxID=3127649 RepID=UPI003105DA9F